MGEQATTTFTPAAPLAENTTYFWRIDEVGGGGVTPGPVWSFTTVVTDPYLVWAAASDLTSGENDDPLDDPDFDGIPNLLEFVLGGHPLTADSSVLPSVSTTPSHAIFTFTRSDASESTTLIFQYGDDLQGWTDIPIGAHKRFSCFCG
jgi:hypothetical protein